MSDFRIILDCESLEKKVVSLLPESVKVIQFQEDNCRYSFLVQTLTDSPEILVRADFDASELMTHPAPYDFIYQKITQELQKMRDKGLLHNDT